MKKIIILSLLVLGVFPFNSYATSGACSGHGGVDCSALGVYATCYDGTKSSVFYSDMEMCKSTTKICLTPNVAKVTSSDCARMASQAYQNGGYYSGGFSQEIKACNDAVTNYENELARYNSCKSGSSSGSATYHEDSYKKVVIPPSTACKRESGKLASYINGKCVCDDGYDFNENRVCVKSKTLHEEKEVIRESVAPVQIKVDPTPLSVIKKTESAPKPVQVKKEAVSMPSKVGIEATTTTPEVIPEPMVSAPQPIVVPDPWYKRWFGWFF